MRLETARQTNDGYLIYSYPTTTIAQRNYTVDAMPSGAQPRIPSSSCGWLANEASTESSEEIL
jgi:hypothetical protein